MKRLAIKRAQEVCEVHDAIGCIIIIFSDSEQAGASYGATKEDCRQLGKTLNSIFEKLSTGEIPVWE